jgi:hypothetical protein
MVVGPYCVSTGTDTSTAAVPVQVVPYYHESMKGIQKIRMDPVVLASTGSTGAEALGRLGSPVLVLVVLVLLVRTGRTAIR